jgi:hypothetical protein
MTRLLPILRQLGFALLVVALWLILQQVLLPKLGVQT